MRDDKTSIEMDRLQNTVTSQNIELGKYRRELEQARETLHDKYVMAALTGLIGVANHHQWGVDEIVRDAHLFADACMKARKA